jgi:hypothetical protein
MLPELAREATMNRSITTLAVVFAAGTILAGAARAETVPFAATLNGASEVPAKTTDGKGAATASLDTTSKILTYSVEYSALTGPATAAHFHGPAEAGANAGVVVKFDMPASPIKGTATLTDAQMADLMAGKWYANVHTAANPGGEIRGQMIKGK